MYWWWNWNPQTFHIFNDSPFLLTCCCLLGPFLYTLPKRILPHSPHNLQILPRGNHSLQARVLSWVVDCSYSSIDFVLLNLQLLISIQREKKKKSSEILKIISEKLVYRPRLLGMLSSLAILMCPSPRSVDGIIKLVVCIWNLWSWCV